MGRDNAQSIFIGVRPTTTKSDDEGPLEGKDVRREIVVTRNDDAVDHANDRDRTTRLDQNLIADSGHGEIRPVGHLAIRMVGRGVGRSVVLHI